MAWCPYRKHEIKRIEKVEQRATKLVPALRNKIYCERLNILGLTSLEDRRVRGDLIQYELPFEVKIQPTINGFKNQLYKQNQIEKSMIQLHVP
ncbi:unnamed protein product [Brachionus calyciflorus]|uniref:Uncharacterized protein n=1 Tax=Brachionus calyciflorus TaxID=104777 RepID=A0A814E3U3_9BILA|nr:unnamed protein product [Brachionus calyciflorus]